MGRFVKPRIAAVCAFALLAGTFSSGYTTAADSGLDGAQQHLLGGRYTEAKEAYSAVAQRHPAAAAIGRARCEQAVGRDEEAAQTLQTELKRNPEAADLYAELGMLAFNRGDFKAAGEHVDKALELEPDELQARWLRAELWRSQGELDKADGGYKWLVDFYNGHEVKQAEALRWIGLAAAQYARWNRLGDQFGFLVNDLYPEALELNKSYWPAHYESGRLFLEKFNDGEAKRQLKAALALNPNAAEVHAALGMLSLQSYALGAAQSSLERARDINPKLLAAHHLQIDLHLARFAPSEAAEAARVALQQNANCEQTLGRLAAAYYALDSRAGQGPPARCQKIIDQVSKTNPRAGQFYVALAAALDKLRRFPASAQYYRLALERMPQLGAARGDLGLTLMRLGDEAQAKKLLDDAFDADPFNVRVSNTLKVLEVLEQYETLETRHFLIRFDPRHDKILAACMGRYLEEVYPALTRQFDFEPPEKSLIEVFNRAKNTDAHGWFAARIVGLPQVHTIGACAGKMVAVQSPNGGPQTFNWARVIKHELVHVINLQQTNFNVPHWFTEGLAVLNEEMPRSAAWNTLLAERHAAGRLFKLDTINEGFIRPHSSDDWTLAYCQSELYVEYMQQRFGKEALAKMLAAYSENQTTAEALRSKLGVEQAEFEAGFMKHIDKLTSTISRSAKPTPTTLSQLQRALAADAVNPDLMAQLAKSYLDRSAYADARRHADAALKLRPKHQLATYVRARLHLLIGDTDEANKLLEAALDRAVPQENLLGLLAGLRLKSGNYAEAAELYELGAAKNTDQIKWTKSLAQVYLKSGDVLKLAEKLSVLADDDFDDLAVRKKLTQLALDAKDYAAASRWATQALHIDVMDAGTHRQLAEASAGRNDFATACHEYGMAIELKPKEPSLRLALAKCHVQAKQTDEARIALGELLKLDPGSTEAKELLGSLKP